MNNDVIRPLDDLVAKHGKDLKKNQLITINGKIMAVAFMANAQHLVYREDVLKKIGMQPPKTYDDVLAAAEKIRSAGIMQNPVGGAYKAGWNLAQEFNNMYMGFDGSSLRTDLTPSINNANGVECSGHDEISVSLYGPRISSPMTVTPPMLNSSGQCCDYEPVGIRAGAMDDVDGVSDEVKNGMNIAGPMTVGGGNTSINLMVGWLVIASNMSAMLKLQITLHCDDEGLDTDHHG